MPSGEIARRALSWLVLVRMVRRRWLAESQLSAKTAEDCATSIGGKIMPLFISTPNIKEFL